MDLGITRTELVIIAHIIFNEAVFTLLVLCVNSPVDKKKKERRIQIILLVVFAK